MKTHKSNHEHWCQKNYFMAVKIIFDFSLQIYHLHKICPCLTRADFRHDQQDKCCVHQVFHRSRKVLYWWKYFHGLATGVERHLIWWQNTLKIDVAHLKCWNKLNASADTNKFIPLLHSVLHLVSLWESFTVFLESQLTQVLENLLPCLMYTFQEEILAKEFTSSLL